ncbi:antibiotic biosynthesis monooxygenase [filamentous cyanobacterium LEGE 11480]|uniref:Antibiotic biosynthesis monooxygenase n=1 Tax=Romeriopsis navalis LEGE 11480 TaxID=2777977 RepID=A0A928VQ59_9CYAN|nr:antibiotic biosynthesis monooxygenase [Romeriopsis navalis]MBE9030502.1 antibiotic biosynthesis monooxygenase [Romeriopsis navalis LEGE 11480]
MAKLTITGNVVAHPAKINLVKAELEKLIPITRQAADHIQYDLHQDQENPAYFMFSENWESRAGGPIQINTPHLEALMAAAEVDIAQWPMQMNAPHLDAFMAATEGAIAQFWLREMTYIA